MSDRIHALTVVLSQDVRAEDCQPLIDAIMQLRGVLAVTAHVADSATHMAQERARRALIEQLSAVLR